MSMNRAAIIDAVEQYLQDTGNVTFSAAEIGKVIDNEALHEISTFCPYVVRETLSTGANREISLSAITDLAQRGHDVGDLEFPIDQVPRRFRNYSMRGRTLVMDINFTPSSGETVYLYAHKNHHLDPDWTQSTPAVGSVVAPATQNGYRYECTTSGTTGTAAPTWGTVAGGTVADGAAVWTTRGEDSASLDDPELEGLFVKLVAGKAAVSKVRAKSGVMTLSNEYQELKAWGYEVLASTQRQLRAKTIPRMDVEYYRSR